MFGNFKPPLGSSAPCKGTGTYTCVVGMLRETHTPKSRCSSSLAGGVTFST